MEKERGLQQVHRVQISYAHLRFGVGWSLRGQLWGPEVPDACQEQARGRQLGCGSPASNF